MTGDGSAALPLAQAIKAMRERTYGSHDNMAAAYGERLGHKVYRPTLIDWEKGKHVPEGDYRALLIEDGVDPRLFIDRAELERRLTESDRLIAQAMRENAEVREQLRSIAPPAPDTPRRPRRA